MTEDPQAPFELYSQRLGALPIIDVFLGADRSAVVAGALLAAR